MKFGKYIQSASAEWASPWYMEYKGLKKIISALESAGSGYTLLAAPPPDDDQALKTTFFYKLDRDLEKVNGFYMQKEGQFRIRLRTLTDKLRLYEKRKRIESLRILKEAHVQFINDLAKLQKFVMINSEGFRKILKKYDKRSKSATKDAYMARQVKTKPCFNSESLIELTDIASNQIQEIMNLIKVLDSGNSSNAHLLTLNGRDSEISLVIPRLLSKATSPSEINSFDLNEFESNLQEFVKLSQVSNLSHLLDKRKVELEGYCAEDLEIIGRVFLNTCNDASLEVFECFLSHVPELTRLGIRDDISDRTPLHELAISGRIKVLRMLLEKGLHVDPEDTYGRRPIHYSCMYGHISSSLLLISHKADLESPDHDGATPLVHAIRGGHVQLIELLMEESGVNLEYSSEVIQNPLIVSVQLGNLEITEKLLKRRIQILPDSHGLSPLHISCRMGYSGITSILLKYGAQIDASDNFYGWQPIFFAVSEGHLECARELIQAGCRLDVKDENGWSPWTLALYHGHIDVAKLLEESSQGSRSGDPSFGSVRPIAPSGLLDSNLGQQDSEIDGIPSLSLPPPIIPCRIYGHTYLDKKVLIRIQFGSYKSSSLEKSPLRLFGSHQLSTVKLELTPKPDELASYTVSLPLKDMESFDFMVADMDAFSVQFDVYPMFGTKSIGRAIALPSIFKILSASSWSGAGEYETCICPMFDSHLNVVGEVEFEFCLIKPFVHSAVQIGGKVDTYWKSTAIIPTIESNSEQCTIQSFITASSLAEEYLDAIVQITSDGIPVAYPYWYLPFEGFPVYIASITYAQAKALFIKSKGDAYKGNSYLAAVNDRSQSQNSSYLSDVIYDSFLTLEELLQTLPSSLGICINIKYPTASQRSILKITNTSDAHLFVERILKLVYDNATRSRSIIFSSFNPSICSIINWKQPNYGVFFGTRCGYLVQEGPWRQLEAETDIRCNSIKEAIKFAKSSNLLGIICEAAPITSSPTIIDAIKKSGLLLAIFGPDNQDPLKIREQHHVGVDAIISHHILRYNNA